MNVSPDSPVVTPAPEGAPSQADAAPPPVAEAAPAKPAPKIVKYAKFKRRFVAIPQLNKGKKAARLLTDRWEIFAACMVFTYTLLNQERFKGVVISLRFRFSSFEEVYGGDILKRYADIFPKPLRDRKDGERLTDRQRIRRAIKMRVPCFVLSWHLPEEGPELDQSYFLPLSLVTRHRGQMERVTSLPHRKDDGELRDRRFVWTENVLDGESKQVGLTILGSCDLDNPERASKDDCLIFIESEPGVGNALVALYDLLVRSGHLGEITKFLVATREELEKLEETEDGVVPEQTTADEALGDERSVRRRKAGDAPLPPRPDETDHGGRRDQAVEPEAPKPVQDRSQELKVKSGRPPAALVVNRWKCANKDYRAPGSPDKGNCPDKGKGVDSTSNLCRICGATMTKVRPQESTREAQKALESQQQPTPPPAP